MGLVIGRPPQLQKNHLIIVVVCPLVAERCVEIHRRLEPLVLEQAADGLEVAGAFF